jgi:formylglycine-generating enzyme required for sulfatase activity
MSGKIFLNYRRDDSRWPTLSLYNLLAQGFPREQLFMDVEGYIRPGDDFVEVLEEQVSACEVMIVVIGPQWLSLTDDSGSPRIADAKDFVHIEIATALTRKIRVIPALVDGASMPKESALPAPLKALTRRQAIRLSHDRFNADGQGLVKALQESLDGKKATAASSDPALRVRPGYGESFRDGDASWAPEMVVVPAGSFLMGTEQAEIDAHCKKYTAIAEYLRQEGPQHRVTIAKPFAIGRFPVTRGEFTVFVKETGHSVPNEEGSSFRDPGFAQDESHPVVCVCWADAKAYANWLSGKTGKDYRLPSEAEWEYACRAGTLTPFWWGSSISTEQANYDGTYTFGGRSKSEFRKRTVPVKSFEPNPWGLYQVHGNVWEWCEDCCNESYKDAPASGSAWTAGNCANRILRGGCWNNDPWHLRAAYRADDTAGSRDDSVGFRLARTLTP